MCSSSCRSTCNHCVIYTPPVPREGSHQRLLIHHHRDLAFDLADWLALYGRLAFDSPVPHSRNKETMTP